MKSIIKLATALLLPFSLLSCGDDKKEEGGDSSGSNSGSTADSHSAVIKDYTALGLKMGDEMAAIKDKASAEAFGKQVLSVGNDISAILKRAEALPAPTDEEKAEAQAANDKVEKAMMKKMMAMQKAQEENPPSAEDQAAINEVMQKLMLGDDGKKIEEVTGKIEKLYGITSEPIE
ncbi:MAG: hypothetical protein ACON38_17015 [Akkermansiaceae bacterium]